MQFDGDEEDPSDPAFWIINEKIMRDELIRVVKEILTKLVDNEPL